MRAVKVKTIASPPIADDLMRKILSGEVCEVAVKMRKQPPKWVDKFAPSANPDFWIGSGVFIRDSGGFFGRGNLEVRGNWESVRLPAKVGDSIWFRERFAVIGRVRDGAWEGVVEYGCDQQSMTFETKAEFKMACAMWHLSQRNRRFSSMQMPRELSRLKHTITRISAEQRDGKWYWILGWAL